MRTGLLLTIAWVVLLSSCDLQQVKDFGLTGSTNVVIVPAIHLVSDSKDDFPNLSATVYLSSETPFAKIEGSTNSGRWWQEQSHFLLNGTTTVMARAVRDNYYDSDTSELNVLFYKDALHFDSIIGSQGNNPGQFNQPIKSVVAWGRLYVLDTGIAKVQVFDTNGTFITNWGNLGVGAGSMKNPYAIAAYEGNLYIAEVGNNRISVFTTNGVFVKTWGSYGTNSNSLNSPTGISVSKGKVYVCDSANNRVQIFNTNGGYLNTITTTSPFGVAVAENKIYIAEHQNHRILVADEATLKTLYAFGGQGTGNGQLWYPVNISEDKGRLFVADYYNHRVEVFNLDGRYITQFGGSGSNPGQMNYPISATAVDGKIYVTDYQNYRVQVFSVK